MKKFFSALAAGAKAVSSGPTGDTYEGTARPRPSRASTAAASSGFSRIPRSADS